MPGTLDLQTFVRVLQGKTLDLKKAGAHAALRAVNLNKADINKDGQITGDAELKALFAEIDRFDRDGKSRSVDVAGSGVAGLVRAIGELAGADILRELARDDILFVGLNPTSPHEASQLRKRGNGVVFIGDAAKPDTVAANGKTYDLSREDQLTAFAGLLGLPSGQTKDVQDAIRSAGSDARDEIASVAWMWATAEKGGHVPGRFVLSGHSIGERFWGDNNGRLQRDSVHKLAKAMPKAAAQVEDLHLSACYCGGLTDLLVWQQIFPNVSTIWAYSGSAPGSYTGAVDHLHLWDMATRGDKRAIDRTIADKTFKGEYVAVWSKVHGYVEKQAPRPLVDLQRAVQAGEATFASHFKGDANVADPQSGPLRDHYNDVQALWQHPSLPVADRPRLEKRRDATIRLLYFDKSVKKNFARQHAGLIRDGYRGVGLTAPDFAALSRKKALESIAAFETAFRRTANSPPAARSLLIALTSGLRDLEAGSPPQIPETWIE
jgi:hypothetical protein